VIATIVAAGVLMSMSRGAWLGAMAGGALTLATARRGRLNRLLSVLLLSVCIVAAVIVSGLGLGQEFQQRVASVADATDGNDGRLQLWRDSLRIAADFWRTGSGLGTFGFIQPQYQTTAMFVHYDRAENMFVEVLVEGGVVALVVSVLTIVLAGYSMRVLLQHGGNSFDIAVGAMGWFALCSQSVCAFFDFGLRYPANCLLVSLIVGAVLGRAALLTPVVSRTGARRFVAEYLPLLWTAGLIVGLGWGWREMAWAAGIDVVLNRGQIDEDEAAFSREELDELIQGTRFLLDQRPDDGEGHARLAELYVVKYRHRVLAELQDELGTVDRDTAWQHSSPMVLHERAAAFARGGETEWLDALRANPVIDQNLRPAVQEALLARTNGPFLVRAHQLLAQLWFLVDDPLNDAPHIARAVSLRPMDPEVLYWAGVMHFQSGRLDDACIVWRRCLSLTLKHDEQIYSRMLPELTPAELVQRLLPDAPEAIRRFAKRQQSAGTWEEYREYAGQHLLKIAQPSTAREPDRLFWIGLGSAWAHNDASALENLHAAVRRRPDHIEWRIELANTLREQGQLSAAIQEAVMCTRLQPGDVAAKQLLEALLEEQHRQRRDEASQL